jgi:hypothetical protein
VPVPEEELLGLGVQEWVHLPLWLTRDVARTAWDVDDTRARAFGLRTRPLVETVTDTWAWQSTHARPPLPPGAHRQEPGLPPDLEEELLTTHPGDQVA